MTSNPNFGKQIMIENVELAKEPLAWPFIEILVDDKVREDNLFGAGGCEDTFTTISLLSYAKEIVG